MIDITKPHDQQVTEFLASQNLTMEQAVQFSAERKAELDGMFRAARRAAENAYFKDEQAEKISRAALKRLLPIGSPLTLIFAMGQHVNKPRTVAEHRSYGFEFRTPEGRLSSLRFEHGETVWKQGDIVTVRDKDGITEVRYRIGQQQADQTASAE